MTDNKKQERFTLMVRFDIYSDWEFVNTMTKFKTEDGTDYYWEAETCTEMENALIFTKKTEVEWASKVLDYDDTWIYDISKLFNNPNLYTGEAE